jgi:hypothetical protein
MPATARLSDIVDALEMQFDESPSFPDLDTGEVETVCRDLLLKAEESADDEEPDLPLWQRPEMGDRQEDCFHEPLSEAGFGLVAWPADYGTTGVKTFIVNQAGAIYEKDIPPTPGAGAAAITRPDLPRRFFLA